MITVNLDKAKAIAHNWRRRRRDLEFKPFDEVIMKQIPGADAIEAEARRAAIRTKYEQVQTAIDAATTPAKIKAALDATKWHLSPVTSD